MESGIEKRCIIELLRNKYRRAKKKENGVIIDELISKLDVSRKGTAPIPAGIIGGLSVAAFSTFGDVDSEVGSTACKDRAERPIFLERKFEFFDFWK